MKSPYICLIEDDELNRHAIRELLQYEGYSVIEFANGKTALEHLKTNSNLPCLLIVDLIMPIMTGRQFLKEVIKHEEIANIPLIVCSTSDEELENLRPAKSYFRKPIDIDSFLEVVEKYCGKIVVG